MKFADKAILLIAASLAGLIAIGASSEQKPPDAIKSGGVTIIGQAPQQGCKVQKVAYDRLRTGSSYRRAVSELGCEGEEISRSEIAGFRSVIYMWRGRSLGANMNATFSNDELVGKAQFGLD